MTSLRRLRPLRGVVAALGALALVALLVLPRVAARTPRRPSTAPTVSPTLVVSPAPVRPLKFPHGKHPKADFPCEKCHASAPTSESSADLLVPPMKVCEGCHDEAKVPAGFGQAGKTDNKACRTCHTAFNAKGFPQPLVWKAPRFKFSHKLHLAQKVACLECHQGVDQATTSAKVHLPTMQDCFKCHNGKGRAPSRCQACHERNPGGRMRVSYPEGVIKPGPSLPALNHTATFGRQHKVAAADQAACESCHEKSSCLSCHAGVTRPASIHLGNYVLTHGREARANRQRCQSCHTRERFCQSCHSRSGVAPSNEKSPYVIPGVAKFHGSDWASSTAKTAARNRHAVHARRNAGTCASCHRERDCMSCHARTRTGGLGMNPHGSGFRFSARCKTLRRKNPRACEKCHGHNDPILLLCR